MSGYTLWGGRIYRLEWAGLLLGLLGVVFLNAGTELRANPVAAVILFVAPISWAFGSVVSRSLTQAAGSMASAAQMLTAGAVFIPVALLRGERFTQVPSLNSALALLYLITFGSLLAYSAYVYLLGAPVRPAVLSSYAYVNPVVAVFLGVWLVGETFTSTGMVGMGIILVGVVLAITAKAGAKPAAATKPSADT